MSGLNNVVVSGNLTRDPELRHTKEKVPLCDMRIAINTRNRGADDVLYIDVTAWESQALSCVKCLKKGSHVAVDGRLKLNKWVKDGDSRQKIVITAHRVIFLDPLDPNCST